MIQYQLHTAIRFTILIEVENNGVASKSTWKFILSICIGYINKGELCLRHLYTTISDKILKRRYLMWPDQWYNKNFLGNTSSTFACLQYR